eukprot:TRINITY_DN28362_c0_g1_i1.p1 TRINITY_DN28362_c0_g1~~TRINITY_DN28362_c0_g1_i1.p1  ORF type:complete len:940 (-),score=328.76 TRINITY_DN28362_c0_g1_i1:243-3062(-)
MSGNDSKFFQTTKKGEVKELKEELANPSKQKKKEAVKKVIAAMTVGKDVSMLFPDVVNCMQTTDVELKKLVYLYVMNYAKSNPDLAIMAVNTFVKDTQDPNALIRALAIRTMGCIRVDKITEYLCGPLAKCLKDEDPYVRKTAAVCVAKLYDISPELVDDHGFLDSLKELLSDPNPMVVANTVAALSEISEIDENNVLEFTPSTIQKLQAALNECTEWGQVFILDSLAHYTPSTAREAENIIERITPRLNHANSAVVLSAVKILIRYIDLIDNNDLARQIMRKMAPSLVTLLSREPEVQYVALRNINLIVQRRANILANEVKVFFCKYNDPIYVKMEKLEIMIRLANDRNIDQVLLEFKEYATEIDVEFVRKSVRAIGRCAIKLERAAERCINVLLELIKTKVNYVVQEAIVVIKDIFRKYPERYESIIAPLCENLDTLDEPEAKASMIWIIGEYAERIDNADELLESFMDSFQDEPPMVQLQLLTAIVKLFLKKPTTTQEMVQQALTIATQTSENPDLRDRGYMYWRLLSTDPEAAKKVVLADKPTITDNTNQLDPGLLDQLTEHISMLSSVYHKPPEAFVTKLKAAVHKSQPRSAAVVQASDSDDDTPAEQGGDAGAGSAGGAGAAGVADLLDLGGFGGGEAAPAAAATASQQQAAAPVNDADFFNAPSPAVIPKQNLCDNQRGKGCIIDGALARVNGAIQFHLTFKNATMAPMSQFAIQFNQNSFSLTPGGPLPLQGLAPGASQVVVLPVTNSGQPRAGPPSPLLQVAIKHSAGVVYFDYQIPMPAVLVEGDAGGRFDRQTFLSQWKSIPDANEKTTTLNGVQCNADAAQQKLEANNIFFIAKRQANGNDVLYVSARSSSGAAFLTELTFSGTGDVKMSVKTEVLDLVGAFGRAVHDILKDVAPSPPPLADVAAAPAAAPVAAGGFGADPFGGSLI